MLRLNPNHVPALSTYGFLLYLAYNDYDQAEGEVSLSCTISDPPPFVPLDSPQRNISEGLDDRARASPFETSAGRGEWYPLCVVLA